MTVTVLLPAHDEAGAIVALVRAVRENVADLAEVLVVDDGSTDGTAELAAGAGARVLRLPHNCGKGHAVRHGIAAATGEIVVVMDADGQDDAADLPRLLAGLAPGVDMVIGSRYRGRFDRGAITPLHWVGTLGLTLALDALYGVRLTDVVAGFRAFRRARIDAATLTASRYEIEVDLVLAVLESGGHIVEVPVRRHPRAHGASGLATFRDGTRILALILRRRVRSLRSA